MNGNAQSILEINRLKLHISLLKKDCAKLRSELEVALSHNCSSNNNQAANEEQKEEISSLKSLLENTVADLNNSRLVIQSLKSKCETLKRDGVKTSALKKVIYVTTHVTLGSKGGIISRKGDAQNGTRPLA